MQKRLVFRLINPGCFLLFLLSANLHAYCAHIAFCDHYYLGAGGGISYAHIAHQNTTILTGTSLDTYANTNETPWSGVFQFNGGFQFPRMGYLPIFSVGLGFYDMSSKYAYKGQLTQSTGAIYNYSYTITSARVMIEAQATLPLNTFSPFINIGVGPSWNNMDAYAETPANALAAASPLSPFQSRVNSNLAYQVGTGLEYGFNLPNDDKDINHELLSLGYRYVYLGPAAFFTRGPSYPFSLDKGVLTVNEFYLSWKHLF